MRINFRNLFFLITITCNSVNAYELKGNIKYVDPFIGAEKSRWTFFTPVSRPFGMVKAGPIMDALGGYSGGGATVGYDTNSETIQGFSFLREFQLGGGIVFTPLSRS
jgi:hypothetical protein